MIVLDASAALSGLFNAGQARRVLSVEQVHVPHLIDVEVANALRRMVNAGQVGTDDVWAALDTWRRLALTRHPADALLVRIWDLRENLSAYDASYVALAEGLGCHLVTADARLSRAPGVGCPITVIPR